MKKTLLIMAGGLTGLLGLGMLANAGYEAHESDEAESREMEGYSGFWSRFLPGNAESNSRRTAYRQDPLFALYQKECGECHVAYPPNMLAQQSWDKMLKSLDDHFGDNAELDAGKANSIGKFLDRNAAGQAKGGYSARMWQSANTADTPLRISDTDYFRGKHHEIPSRMVVDNPQVKSFSRCEACHVNAGKGSFNEHEVRISGFGRWED